MSRNKRSVFRVAEPVVRLHQLLIQRHEPELVVGRAERVWEGNADTVAGKIYGPHFEELARQWCFEHAAPESLGGRASWVRPTELSCREHRRGHELDLVVAQSPAFDPTVSRLIGTLAASGEKANEQEVRSISVEVVPVV